MEKRAEVVNQMKVTGLSRIRLKKPWHMKEARLHIATASAIERKLSLMP